MIHHVAHHLHYQVWHCGFLTVRGYFTHGKCVITHHLPKGAQILWSSAQQQSRTFVLGDPFS